MSEKRRGLGRGLDALLRADEAVRTLPVAQLHPNRFQPRTQFEETGLAELAESIRVQGVVQPLIVTPRADGAYSIVAGERRWRAAQRAGLAQVPVVVRELSGDQELLELALVENLQRADLNPVEEAEGFRALAETFRLAHEEIGARVGRSRTAITNALRLLKLPGPVLDLLRSGELNAGQARPLLALAEVDAVELAQRAVREGLPARRLEALAAAPAGGRRRRPLTPDPHTAAAAERLTQRLQTKVEIERRGKGGSLRIHFHSEEELMRLFELLIERGGRQ